MQTVNPQVVSNKKVLLRLDIDVPLRLRSGSPTSFEVAEDFRLRAGLPTLEMCLANASEVIVLGHIGRPEGKVVPELSIEPIRQWLKIHSHLTGGKLEVLENLRFDPREEACDISFAKELASLVGGPACRQAGVFVNEAFASYRPAASTTVLPMLLPHYAGLRFAQEVEKLTQVRENPKKPFVAIMGGAKVKDKLPVINILAQKADAVLVGGKLIHEIREQNINLPKNVMVGMLSETGFDIAAQTTEAWSNLIGQSQMIVWNGPVGKFEDPQNGQSAKLAQMVLNSEAQIIVGGGDTISLLESLRLLKEYEKKGFVSTGGGAMLKFLAEGTLATIEVLQ